jgi:hypothetical protein
MKNRYVYAELAGGIGNQIFIFEMAKYLLFMNKGKIILNNFHSDKTHSKGKSDINDYLLGDKVTICKHNKIINILSAPIKKYLKLINKLSQNFILVFDDTDSEFSKNKMMDLISIRDPKIILIFGFWQDFSHWGNNHKYSLKHESEKLAYLLGELVHVNPIIFHYRLSTSNENWNEAWGELSPIFLADSLSSLSSKFKFSASKKVVWIFSNNLDYAKKLLNDLSNSSKYEIKFIDDSGLLPSEIITIFSMSKFLICSNSTFGIVAAKIGSVPNVIIPSVFSKYSSVDMNWPSHWVKIQSTWLK